MNKKISYSLTIGILMILIFSAIPGTAIYIKNETIKTKEKISTSNTSPYEGRLTIYVVEPESRWLMKNLQPFHYAVLDFALDEDISIDYLDFYEKTFIWTDNSLQQDNVIVIAAVFNSQSEQNYADTSFSVWPYDGYPFDAHYVDAVAGALPGNNGWNIVNDDFTHTVLIEVGSKTTCSYCPIMANALNNIYQSGDYPFYFVELVHNKNTDSWNRLFGEYNHIMSPTAYYDGGYKVLNGGQDDESPYRTMIEECASREVHKLGLNLAVQWLEQGKMQIEISIENNDQLINPLKPTKPSGLVQIKVNQTYEYSTMTTDPNGDQVYYKWDWGDGSESEWIGPFNSGEIASAEHKWEVKNNYDIKVKAKDIDEHESPWSNPLEINVESKSKEKNSNFIFYKLMEKHLNLFRILRYIINL